MTSTAPNRFGHYVAWSGVTAACLVWLRIVFGYPLFHSLAEIFAITVAIGTFMITWNARDYLDNGYLLLLGIAYFFIAGVDILHTLAYRGVEVFEAYSATELPTQLWLAGRYLQASALLIAPAFVTRRVRPTLVLASYAAAATALCVAVFAGAFPSVLSDPGGLTGFKIGSEIMIIAAFGVGLALLMRRRSSFDKEVWSLLVGSIAVSIGAEITFTLYATPESWMNLIGHLARILSYFLLYRAIIVTSVSRPYDVLFHQLNQTAESLRLSERMFRSTVEQSSVGISHISLDGHVTLVNERMAEITGYSCDEMIGMNPLDITHVDDRETDLSLLKRLEDKTLQNYQIEKRYVRKDGSDVWAHVSRSLVHTDDGRPDYHITMVQDITARKAAEESLHRSRDLSQALNAIDRAINSTLDAEQVMSRVASLGSAVIGAQSGTIWTLEKNSWVPRFTQGHPSIRIGQHYSQDEVAHIREAVRTSEPHLVTDPGSVASDSELAGLSRHVERDFTSSLAIPLELRGERFGALTFSWNDPSHAFTDEERDFARKLGFAFGLAMDNARLYEGERRVADTLQASMLSVDTDIPGIDVAWAYRSATELASIGGDFFDVFTLPDARVAFVIGDVAGKGIEAAALTSIAKSTIRAFAHELRDPATVMAAANRSLSRQVDESRFITAVYTVLEPKSGTIQVACAGHPLPLVADSLGCTDQSETRNPPLAVFTDIEFDTYEVRLTPGMQFVMFSDGLLDARSGDDFFGETRVRRIVDTMAHAEPRAIVDKLLVSALELTDGPPTDDIAILAFRYNGISEGQHSASVSKEALSL